MNALWTNPEDAIAWAETQPWVRDMAQCPQDPSYHAEGDVWTHSKMMLRQLPKHPRWSSFSAGDKGRLVAGGLLHDSGKPETTKNEAGVISSKGHSRAGGRFARRVLRELGIPLAVREDVVNLVNAHGWPPHTVESQSPEMEVIRTAWLCRNDLLAALCWADVTGRIGKDAGFADALGIWEDLAHELDCWDHPFPGANDEARLLAFEGKDIRFYSPREEYRCTMTLLSGLPGAGKDTWLRRNAPEMPVVSLDALREDLEVAPTDDQGGVVAAGREQVREHLRAGEDFAFNATNVTREVRGRWLRLARDYNARIRIIYVEPPLDVIIERNSKRPHPVPERVIRSLAERLEVPQWSEAHRLELVS